MSGPASGGSAVDEQVRPCPGPLFWVIVPVNARELTEGARMQALVECQMDDCGFLLVGPTPPDEAHRETTAYRWPNDSIRGPMPDPGAAGCA